MKVYKNADALAVSFDALVPLSRSFQTTVFRAVLLEYANRRDLLSGEGTRQFGGRWTFPGCFATVHASLDTQTALSECLGTQQRYGIAMIIRLPLALVGIDCRLQAVLDLTDTNSLKTLGLTKAQLLGCPWRESMEKGQEALTQAVGRIAFAKGIEALLGPSAARRNGKNLIVFPDRLRQGSVLAIQNVEKLPAAAD